MAELDPQYETFAQALAMGFTPGMAAREACLDLTPVECQVLSGRQDVRERMNEIVARDQFDMSNEHLRVARQLEIDRDFAYETGNVNAAINATVQRAKLLGVYVERTETTNNVAVRNGSELSPEEWSAKFAHATGDSSG